MKRKNRIDKNRPIRELSVMCRKYFGVDYEHWNWIIEEYDSGVTQYGIAIELPKKLKDGSSVYTNPFITRSNGCSKGLVECANMALVFMYSKFEGITYDYSSAYNPVYDHQ